MLSEEAVEQNQLLLAVGRIIDGVQIEGEPSRRHDERGNELIDALVTQPFQRGNRDAVFEPRQGRLAGKVEVVGVPIRDQLEYRIAAKRIVIILVDVVSQNAIDT